MKDTGFHQIGLKPSSNPIISTSNLNSNHQQFQIKFSTIQKQKERK